MITANYQEVDLATVMQYFAAGFTPKEGLHSVDGLQPEWFIDIGKGLVVFKLFTEPDDAPPEVESPENGERQRNTA